MTSKDGLCTYPESWEVVKLGSFVESEKGKKPKNQASDYSSSYSLPYIDIQAFEKGVISSYTDGRDCRICHESDFLMVWDGSRSGLVGKGMKGALGSTLVRINFPLMENEYAFYFLQSKYQQINSRTKGSGTPHVDPDLLWNYEFPIPPLNEQRRIVSKIEELFSELDKGVESLEKVREQLKVYRQAVLKHAFEGKFTAQWREENKDKLETPEQLCARIKHEREMQYGQQINDWRDAVRKWEAKGKLGKKPSKPKKLVHLPLLTDEDLLILPKLPTGWSWFTLSAIADNIQIGPFGSLLHKADYIVGGTPLINPTHIRFQRIEPDQTLTVNSNKLGQLQKYALQKKDIVIGRRGEMGRCAVVTEKESGWICGTGSLFIRLLPSMNPNFYSQILSSQRVKDFLAAYSIGTTMQNLNEGILHRIPVPVCSCHEQDEVFEEIERQLSTLDHMEAVIDSEIQKSAILRQTTLKIAFSGQLVVQDSNDEPASKLLDRIRVAKSTEKPRAQA